MLARTLASWLRRPHRPIRRRGTLPRRLELLEDRINPAPALISTIAGNDFDHDATLSGFYHIPPDPHGAVGPNHVVSTVNTSIQFHKKDGTLTYEARLGKNGSNATGSFFETLNPVNGLFDAKVVYDTSSDRWIVVAFEQTGSTSRILLAASDDSDPNGTWYFQAINSKLTISGTDYWADYPGLALDEEAIYVTANMFPFSGNGYAARLWIINKAQLYANQAATVNVYDPYAASGSPNSATTEMPAQVYGSMPGNTGTFLCSYSGLSNDGNLGNATGDEFVQIIRVDNPLNSPTFTQQFVDVGNIEDAQNGLPGAPQKGTSTTLEAGDRRVINAVWRNNNLYFAANTRTSGGADNGDITAHWWRIDTTNVANLAVGDQGNVGAEDLGSHTYTYYPSVSVDDAGNMAIGFEASSSNMYAGAYYTGRLATDTAGTVQSTGTLKAGTDYYIRTFGAGRNRYGDYTATGIDPAGKTFWFFGEYSKTRGTAFGGEDGRWATQWGSFTFQSAPVLAAIEGAALAYTENDPPTIITSTITVTDVDSANLASASITISGNYANGEDVLAFTNANGITGSWNATTGVLTLTGSSSVANYQAALRSVTYQDTSDDPSTSQRTVTFKVNDGVSDSNTQTRNINVTAVNDPPVLAGIEGTALAYTENDGAKAITASLTVSDLDNANLSSASIWISTAFVSGEDDLVFSNQNGITGTYNTATGVLSLSGSATLANYQTALRSVKYRNNSDNPSTTTRTVSFKVNDGSVDSNTVTRNIAITAVNDAPVLAGIEGTALAYTENDAPKIITATITASDVDNANLSGATVWISAGFASGEDILAFASANGISGSYDGTAGVLTLTGSSSVANYQAALRAVTYANSSDNPSTITRTVSFKVNDGSADSNVLTRDISITAVNDAPQLNAIEGSDLSYTENDPAKQVTGTLVAADPDNTNLASGQVWISQNFTASEDALQWSVAGTSITASYNSPTGTLSLTGSDTLAHYQAVLRSIKYVNSSDNPSTLTRRVSFKVNDGSLDSNTAFRNVTITAVNDAPVLANIESSALTAYSLGTAKLITSAITTSDVDNTKLASATAAITANFTSGQDSLSFDTTGTSISGSYNSSTGVLSFTGADTLADYQAVLRTVKYANTVAAPVTAARTITFTVNDGSLDSNTQQRTVNVVQNAPPTVSAGGPYTIAEGDGLTLSATANDADGDTLTYTWDVNGDGTFGDATGSSPSLTWAQLQALGIADGPATFNVRARVDDAHDHIVTSAVVTLTLNNTPPTIALSGNASVNEGSSYTINLGAITDPGQDTVTKYKINWGDGTSDSFDGNPSGLAKTHTYLDGPANLTITVDLTDEDGTFAGAGSKAITVNDVAPTIALTGNTHVIEGSAYSLTLGDITDPGQDTVTKYKINWGDGASDSFNGDPVGQVKTHTYADGPNSYSITVDLTDEDGAHVSAGSLGISVDDVAPTIGLTGNANVNEGSAYSLTLGSITDPGQDTVTKYKINWGDGAADSFSGDPVGQVKTHTYADGPNGYTITVDLTDEDGTHASAGSRGVTVDDVAPTIAMTGNASVKEGSSYSLTLGAITDPGPDTVTKYRINWGDGASDSFDGNPTGLVKTHTYADGPNNYTITVDLTDEDGTHAASGSKSITVDDVDPTIALTGNVTVNEGASYSLTLGAITDPGQDTVTKYKIIWGDGASDTFNGSPVGQVKTHTYADGPNSYTVTVDLIDEDGTHVGAASEDVTVSDVPPTIVVAGNSSVNEGATYTVTLGAITDPGQDAVSQWIIHWGDGLSDTYTAGGKHTHVFADGPNDYGVSVDLVDEDGTHANAGNALSVHVNNVAPTATFSYDGPRFEHRPITVHITAPFDPSPVDSAAGFSYSFDFNNDGDFLDADEVSDGATASASHVFAKEGTYTVHGRIKDKDGGFTDYWTNVTVLNADLFIAGTGGSTAGTVKALDSLSGSARFTLTPFGANYKYGISVANGDVTGDLIPDVIVGTAGGSKTTVKVYDGFDGSELTTRQFDAFPGTTTDGVNVAAGDVNGDGYADIIVGAGMFGAPNVVVISGKTGAQLAKFAAYSSGMYGVRVAAGDVNGDGKADIITAPMIGTNPVRIFNGADFKLLRSITPFGSFSGGLFVTAGDLDGDGKAEVVVSQDATANAKVRIFNGTTGRQLHEFTPFVGIAPQPKGARVMLVDRDGDGKLEIVVGAGPSGKGRIRTFRGSTLKLLNELTPFDPNFLGGVYVG